MCQPGVDRERGDCEVLPNESARYIVASMILLPLLPTGPVPSLGVCKSQEHGVSHTPADTLALTQSTIKNKTQLHGHATPYTSTSSPRSQLRM